MSKKLLEESTIRQFMKLAELQPLASSFLESVDADAEMDDADEKEDDADDEEEEVDMDMAADDLAESIMKRVQARLQEMKSN